MISSWRTKRGEKKATKRGLFMKKTNMELVIPSQFTCPISLDLMKDPVTLSSTGITYDRENIEKWINEGGNSTCPITNQELKCVDSNIDDHDVLLIPNHNIRKMIQQWCVENKEYGIDRIPTPKIPVTSSDVTELLAKIANSIKLEMQDESNMCREFVIRVKNLASESDRNKCCFVKSGTGYALSSAFLELSEGKTGSTLEVILSTLVLFLPLDVNSKSILGSISSIHWITWFMRNGSLSSRRNAVFVLREILKLEQHEGLLSGEGPHHKGSARGCFQGFELHNDKVEMLLTIDGALEGLVRLVKEPICPKTTKASLLTIYHMVNSSSSQSSISRFVDVGLVELLLEILVDCDKSICEKALGVLDGILTYEEGVQRGYSYALTIPILVKKLLRISHLASEFSVSILWKICKNDCHLVEALQVGAFQKLLLLLQVGCSETTKEKASQLLKMLNVHRDRVECVDSLDFKGLKRTF